MAAGEQDSTLRLVMLETWLQESGSPPEKLFDKLGQFVSNYRISFFDTNNSLVVYRTRLSCLKHGCWRAGFPAQETVLLSSANLYRIIISPFRH